MTSSAALHRILAPIASVEGGALRVTDASAIASPRMDELARLAVFGSESERHWARWAIWELGQAIGVRSSSIHSLYLARGRGECHGFTVPAINVRGRAYDTARAIFRTAIKFEAGAFILEIARSEIAYTDQRPSEYVAVMLAAALREGFRGPVFIQGDHFQVNAKKFAADAAAEVGNVKQLATEAIHAGFYNIDIDTSTLVDLSKGSLAEQQRLNYEVGVDITRHVRSLQPKGVDISLGGEIGEVGTENSTVAELRAFMDGYNRTLAAQAPGAEGLCKISVQSGASTLPDGVFHNFPRVETAEIHLATGFQNMLYDLIPAALREEMYAWLRANAADERKAGDSDEQFIYKTRKKALGPFKEKLWAMSGDAASALDRAFDQKFEFLFTQLGARGTAAHVARFVTTAPMHRASPTDGAGSVAAAPDDPDAGE